MKSLIFDAGPIISLATNNILWLLPSLKKSFNGKFYITESVKREIVDVPLGIKRFKFEAIQVQKLIEDKTLEILDNSVVRAETPKLLSTANEVFKAFDNYIRIVHFAEMSVLAASRSISASAVVIDEKTTRCLMENPRLLVEILRKSLHTAIYVRGDNLKEFNSCVKSIKLIRSVELVVIAYERGLLDNYITKIPDAKRNLLESVLWGVKFNGCAVSNNEIEQILKIEMRNQ